MATSQDAIRRLTIQASAPGATQATAELQALAAAQGGVAVASATAERATLSLDGKFASIERRYNTALRNQQDYAKLQSQVNAAVAQNPALQDRANAVLAAAADKYGQVTGAQKAFGIASQTVNLQIAALAGGLGLTGQILSAFGPWGFAAAVGLGAVQSALSLASEKSHELAQKAKEIKEFSEATGLTTTQFQALRSEAGKFGIDSETLAGGLTKFTAGFENLRLGQGDLLTQIRRINPAIADQMQQTTDAATAFTLFGKAVAETDNIFQRNALLKAGMGKGASTFGAFFETAPDVIALGAAAQAAGKGIEENLINKLKQLQIDIDKTRSAANSTFASIFGTSTLEGERAYAQGLLELAKYAKEFVLSNDLHKLIDYKVGLNAGTALSVTGGAAAGAAGGAAIGAGIGLFGGGVGAIPGAIAGALAGAIAALIADYTTQEIKKIGAGSLSAIPAAPSFSETFSAANKANADAATSRFIGPPAPSPKTDPAKLADMDRTISLLGSAATSTEKYNASVLKLNIGLKDASINEAEYNRAIGALDLDKSAAQISARVGALGAAATVTDLLTQKNIALAQAQRNDANLTPAEIENQRRLVIEQVNGVGAVNAQIDALRIQAQTLGMSAGASAAFTAVETKRLEAVRNGAPLDEQQLAALRERAKILGEVTQKNAQDAAQGQANFDLVTSGLSDTEKAIAQVNFQLHGNSWADFMNDGLSATKRLADAMKTIGDAERQAFGDLLTNLRQGKSLSDSLTSAFGSFTDKLAKAGGDKLFDALKSGDISKAFSVNVTGATSDGIVEGFQAIQDKAAAARANPNNSFQFNGSTAAAGVGAVGSAVGIYGQSKQQTAAGGTVGSSVLSGALSGALAGAALGSIVPGIGTLVGGAIGLVGGAIMGWFGGNSGAEQAAEKAAADWAAVKVQASDFAHALNGGGTGSLTSAFTQAKTQMQQFADTAQKAGDTDSVNKLNAAYDAFVRRTSEAFRNSFSGIIDALNSGLGPSSPFASAAANVKTVGDQVKGFVEDVRLAFNSDPVAAAGGTSSTATDVLSAKDGSRLMTAFQDYSQASNEAAAQVDIATKAAEKYLLSLLGQAPALSDVATAIQHLQGTATQLQTTLVDLGMSSQDAAQAINAGVLAAMAQLAATFTNGLEREINTVLGNDYLNSTADLIAKRTTAVSDAAALGVDPALVTRWFSVSAQKIVDDAKVTGDAFVDLTTRFPELQGAVHAFADTAAAAIDVLRSAADQAKQLASLQDELFAATNDSSTQAGQIAALDRDFGKRRADEAALGGQLLTDIESLYAAKRSNIVNDFATKALADQVAVAQAAAAAMEAALQRSASFQDRLFAATNDNTTQAGALAAFDRQANQQRAVEAQAGGQAIADLEASLAAERLNIVKDFAMKASDAAVQAAAANLAALTTIYNDATQAVNTAQSAVTSAQGALNDAYQRESSAIQSVIDKTKSYVQGLRDLGNSLKLNAQYSTLSPIEQYNAARAQLMNDKALADGGDADAQGRLQSDINAFLDQSKSFNASTEAYYRDFQMVQDILQSSEATGDRQVSIAQQQLNALNLQTNGLLTINSSVLTVAAAIAGLQAALSGLASAQAAQQVAQAALASAKVEQANAPQSYISGLYQSLLGRAPDASGEAYWNNQIAIGTPLADIVTAFTKSAEYKGFALGGIVGAFANGGMIGNGIYGVDSVLARYAGGGNIALAGGEYVMPAAQTRANMGALDAMRSGRGAGNDNAETNQILRDIASRLSRVEAAALQGASHVREGVDQVASVQKTQSNSQRQQAMRPQKYGT